MIEKILDKVQYSKWDKVDFYQRIFIIAFFLFATISMTICSIFDYYPMQQNLKTILAIIFFAGTSALIYDFCKICKKKSCKNK